MKTIIEMAREAGLAVKPPSLGYTENYHFAGFEQAFERFAELVIENFLNRTGQYVTNDPSREAVISVAIADEREACAKVCEATEGAEGKGIAAAIRARGNT